jgi:hypothetical protein
VERETTKQQEIKENNKNNKKDEGDLIFEISLNYIFYE